MKNYYYLDSASQRKGPHTPEELNELARTRVILRDTYFAADGDPTWSTGAQLEQAGVILFPPDKEPESKIAKTAKLALVAFKQFATDPVGGMPNACKALDNSSATGVGAVFGVVFIACLFVFLQGVLPVEAFKKLPKLNLLLCSAVPFICVAASSFLARSLFRGRGTLGSDCFVAGATLLPLAFLMVLTRLLGVANAEVIVVLSVFTVCLTILMLYAGCNGISGLSERTATFAVPLILLVSAWLAKILFASLIPGNLPGVNPAEFMGK